MFYYLSKPLWFLADPSNLALMLIVIGLVLMGLRLRFGLKLAASAVQRIAAAHRPFSTAIARQLI